MQKQHVLTFVITGEGRIGMKQQGNFTAAELVYALEAMKNHLTRAQNANSTGARAFDERLSL